jgi:hypothetical protein
VTTRYATLVTDAGLRDWLLGRLTPSMFATPVDIEVLWTPEGTTLTRIAVDDLVRLVRTSTDAEVTAALGSPRHEVLASLGADDTTTTTTPTGAMP